MNSQSKYRTRQRELLLSYFKTIPGIHVTAADICAYLKSKDTPVGLATVYRQLENLVADGTVKKYIISANTPACFEYVDPDSHSDGETCFHCKCEKCGKLIHLHCEELEEIQVHLASVHSFKLDPVRTVFYGLCDQCR